MDNTPIQATNSDKAHVPLAKRKLLGLIGLAVGARKAVLGSDAVFAAISSQSAKVVFLATDAGGNTQKKIRDKCAFYHISLIERFERGELGKACGREHMVAVAVTDPGCAAKRAEYAGEYGGGDAFDETSSV